MFFTSVAHAMGAAPQGADGAAANPMAQYSQYGLMIVMFAVLYFLLIRPQQKRAKEHRNMMANLQPGAKVITSGGLYGTIVEVKDQSMVLDLGDHKVTVARSHIAGLQPTPKADKE